MEGFVKGDVIIIEFPYSDLKSVKRRPVLVLKVPKGEDVIVSQITGESYENYVEILLKKEDFKQGSLKRDSYIRIDKIASIEKSLIKYKAGSLKREKFSEIIDKICFFLKN
ncbi:MAG TPA: type II toxin-antitoxin system PemK/MazF family toxin [Candidatus Paceibacterota bacterium]|nr:type II toxin-antitoxin system PemK/MazF family toxin [Candidatus Paceibacterota bacterium]